MKDATEYQRRKGVRIERGRYTQEGRHVYNTDHAWRGPCSCHDRSSSNSRRRHIQRSCTIPASAYKLPFRSKLTSPDYHTVWRRTTYSTHTLQRLQLSTRRSGQSWRTEFSPQLTSIFVRLIADRTSCWWWFMGYGRGYVILPLTYTSSAPFLPPFHAPIVNQRTSVAVHLSTFFTQGGLSNVTRIPQGRGQIRPWQPPETTLAWRRMERRQTNSKCQVPNN